MLTLDIIFESRIDYIPDSRAEEKMSHRTILRLSPGDYYLFLEIKNSLMASSVSFTGHIQLYHQVLTPSNFAEATIIEGTIKPDGRTKIPFTVPESAVSSVVDISVETSSPITTYAIAKDNLDKIEDRDQWENYRLYILLFLGIMGLYLLFALLQDQSLKRGWNIPIITPVAETKPKQRYIPKSEFTNLKITLDEGEIIAQASYSDFLKIKESILSNSSDQLIKTISPKTKWREIETGILILTSDRIVFNTDTQSMNFLINEIRNFKAYQRKGMDPGILIDNPINGEIMLFLVNDPWQWQDFMENPKLMIPKIKTREASHELCIACNVENIITQEFCTNCGTNVWKPKKR